MLLHRLAAIAALSLSLFVPSLASAVGSVRMLFKKTRAVQDVRN